MDKQGKKIGEIKKTCELLCVTYNNTAHEYYIEIFPYSFENRWKIREGK